MNEKTQVYSDDDESRKTQTYQSDATRIYSDTTQTYDEKNQRTTGTLHHLNIGETITLNESTYRIIGIISEHTGEATIYTIQDQQEQMFGLKLYFEFPNPKEEPNPEALRRIQTIKDPDILRLYDFGTGVSKYQGKYCFEICDVAKGGNLLARQEYSLEFLKETVIPQIFKGIRTLHDHKIYHCDLKSENIFWLDAEQTDLVIGDYGSAKTFEESSDKDLRQTTTAKGTMFYLAPEQSIGIISAKNDYYSFGMILLHLLYPNFVNRESLRKIRERQMSKKPITDFDPRYGEFNDLIAGLTLADVPARWGETEVRKWLWGEKVAVVYTTDAEIHPIKLGDATIRMEPQLITYIETHPDWIEDLIEDADGYRQFLSWVADVQDVKRKKVFDNMVKHYRQDGQEFLKQALLRYFDPYRSVQIDMKEYDFWKTDGVEATINQFFQHLDEISCITGIDKIRFYLFQFEFALRQVMTSSDGQPKSIAINTLERIEEILNISIKTSFDAYICHCYPLITNILIVSVLLYRFKQKKTLYTIFTDFHQDIDAQLDSIRILENFSSQVTSKREFPFQITDKRSGVKTNFSKPTHRKLSKEEAYGYLFKLAQYCAKEGDIQICIPVLHYLIERDPAFFIRARNSETFLGKNEIIKELDSIYLETFKRAENAIANAENARKKVEKLITETEQTAKQLKEEKYSLESNSLYNEAQKILDKAKEKLASEDYKLTLEVISIADKALNLYKQAEKRTIADYIQIKTKILQILTDRRDSINSGNSTVLHILTGISLVAVVALTWTLLFSVYDTEPRKIGPTKVYKVTYSGTAILYMIKLCDSYYKNGDTLEVVTESSRNICLRAHKPGGEVFCYKRDILEKGRIVIGYTKDYTNVVSGWTTFFWVIVFPPIAFFIVKPMTKLFFIERIRGQIDSIEREIAQLKSNETV